jgi:hypothetical protein
MEWFIVYGGLLFHRKFVPLSWSGRAAWLTLMLIGNNTHPRWKLGDRDTDRPCAAATARLPRTG